MFSEFARTGHSLKTRRNLEEKDYLQSQCELPLDFREPIICM
jgi:hypothetical protein